MCDVEVSMWSEVWRGSAAVKKKLVGELCFEVRDQTKARNRTRKFLEPKVSKHSPFPFAVVSHCTYPSLLLLRFPPSNHEADCQQNKLPSLQASFFLFQSQQALIFVSGKLSSFNCGRIDGWNQENPENSRLDAGLVGVRSPAPSLLVVPPSHFFALRLAKRKRYMG